MTYGQLAGGVLLVFAALNAGRAGFWGNLAAAAAAFGASLMLLGSRAVCL